MIHRNSTGSGRASWGAGLAALSILAGACSTSSPEGNAWIGSWLCSDQRSSGGASDAGPNTDSAQFMMQVSTTSTANEIMAIEQVDGGTVCSLRFATSSGTASLATGQTCLTASGATMSYTMGTATMQGGSLVVNFAFDLPSASTSGTEAMSCQRYYNSGPVSGGGW
jgi:hypothetical protein